MRSSALAVTTTAGTFQRPVGVGVGDGAAEQRAGRLAIRPAVINNGGGT